MVVASTVPTTERDSFDNYYKYDRAERQQGRGVGSYSHRQVRSRRLSLPGIHKAYWGFWKFNFLRASL